MSYILSTTYIILFYSTYTIYISFIYPILHQLHLHYKHHVHKLPLTSSTAHTPFTSLHQLHLRCIHHPHQKQNLQAMNFYISLSELLPVVPARGEAEVVLGLYYKTFSTYRTCICRAPVRPGACVLCATVMHCSKAALETPHYTLQVALHTSHLHFTLHTSSYLISSEPLLTSSQLFSSNFISSYTSSRFFSAIFKSSEPCSAFLISSKPFSTYLSSSARQKASAHEKLLHTARFYTEKP